MSRSGRLFSMFLKCESQLTAWFSLREPEEAAVAVKGGLAFTSESGCHHGSIG